MIRKTAYLTGIIFSLVLLGACSSAYYKTMEGLGIEKRDILVDRVEEARDAQGDASEQFASALEQFRSTVHFDGGDLEKIYDRLNDEYESSISEAEQVLFLKHNLNARAIGALRNELDSIERDTATLIEQMQKAIAEADAFIQSMET